MSLNHCILGYLAQRPLSGYALKKVMDTTARFFWCAEHPQIYKSLQALEKCGWIKIDHTEKGRRLEKKIYGITAEGRKELERWILEEEYASYVVRDPEIMQFFFSTLLNKERQIQFIESHLTAAKRRLEKQESLGLSYPKEYRKATKNAPDSKCALSLQIVARWGVLRTAAYVKWLEDMLKTLKGEKK